MHPAPTRIRLPAPPLSRPGFLRSALLGVLLLATGVPSAMAYCYTVYNQKSEILYRSSQPPVDTSFQFHQTVPMVFPAGSNLVFGASEEACGEVVYKPLINASQRSANNRKTRKNDRF